MFGLTVLHELMDLLAGFEHFWFGSDTQLGGTVFELGLYNAAPLAGILIELALEHGLNFREM